MIGSLSPSPLPGLTLKAWALVSSVGGNVAQTIVKGFNVTSVTRIATGVFTVVLTANMAGTNYMVLYASDQVGSVPVAVLSNAKAVAGGSVVAVNPSGASVDALNWYFAYYE